jgi:hypothetical protein
MKRRYRFYVKVTRGESGDTSSSVTTLIKMIYKKNKKFTNGDLVEVRCHMPTSKNPYRFVWLPAVILDGRHVSMHIMDRPVKIVDTVNYSVISSGKKQVFREEDIRKISI